MINVIKSTYKIIAYFSILVFFLIVNVFYTQKQIFNNTWFYIIIGLVYLVLFIILNKFVINKLKDKTIIIINGVLLLLFLIFEIISFIYFKVEYNWDFKWVMETAYQKAVSGVYTQEQLDYFKRFPNNLPILEIVTLCMKIFNNNEIGAYILNIIMVFLANLVTVLTANKLGGNKLAFNVSLLALLCMPFYLYTPIVYSDTLSVIFPIATFYFYLLFRNAQKIKNKIILFCLMSAFGIIGFLIKPVAGIVLIAIFIDCMFLLDKKTIYVAISIVMLLLTFKFYNFITYQYVLNDNPKNDIVLPYWHWIMMGLNTPGEQGGTSIGWGAYSQNDTIETQQQLTYEDKVNYNKTIINERLKSFGFKGYVLFLGNKFAYIWDDPTFFVFRKIGWSTINQESNMYKWVIGDNAKYIVLPHIYGFGFLMSITSLCGVILSYKRNEKEELFRILEISVVGIAIFLLIWEARSRYIYFLIPILIILSSKGINKLVEINYESLFRKIKNRIFKRV